MICILFGATLDHTPNIIIYKYQTIESFHQLETVFTKMFAVPGWSVEAKSLITQQGPTRTHAPKVSEPGAQSAQTSRNRKRKRKNDQVQTKGPAITDENLAEFWSKYIEGKGPNGHVPSGKTERQKKKRRKARGSIEDQVLDKAGDNEVLVEEAHEENEKTKDKIHSKPSHRTHDSAAIAQTNGGEPTSENPKSLIQEPETKLDKKARYEQRRIRALEKRSQKSLEQANGTLPPPRATVLSNPPTTISHPDPASFPSITNAPPPKPPILHPKASTIATLPPPEPCPTTLPNALPPSPPSTNLTPLQTSMRLKLISARFRHLNQILYTAPSTRSSSMFAELPSSYTSYHAGFRAQVAVWPQNPNDTFIADIKARAQVGNKGELLGSQKKRWREQRRRKSLDLAKRSDEDNKTEENNKVDALPRSRRGVCTIADLGCGDATLAANLAQLCKPLSLGIHSFDLATGDGPNAHLITVADICGTLPLENSSVDVAIFCLSLMGTNWVDSVQEAARIVRPQGEVWVAEIRSRFARAGEKRRSGIGQRRDEEPSADIDEEDGHDVNAGANETDVGPFADVFRKRGFSLQGEPDLRNKMFAKMRFIKTGHVEGISPGNGVGVGATAGAGTSTDPCGRYGPKPKPKKKFLDPPASALDQQDENKVLKPCLYKTR